MPLALRVGLSLLVAMTVWLIAGQARAAAPLCDARGAITFAPNPTLEEPNASIDIGQADDCSGTTADLVLDHGRGSPETSAQDDGPQSLGASMHFVMGATPTGSLEPTSVTSLVSRADRDRLERPPR